MLHAAATTAKSVVMPQLPDQPVLAASVQIAHYTTTQLRGGYC